MCTHTDLIDTCTPNTHKHTEASRHLFIEEDSGTHKHSDRLVFSVAKIDLYCDTHSICTSYTDKNRHIQKTPLYLHLFLCLSVCYTHTHIVQTPQQRSDGCVKSHNYQISKCSLKYVSNWVISLKYFSKICLDYVQTFQQTREMKYREGRKYHKVNPGRSRSLLMDRKQQQQKQLLKTTKKRKTCKSGSIFDCNISNLQQGSR